MKRAPGPRGAAALVILVAGLFAACDRNAADSARVLRVANWGGPSVLEKFTTLEREIRDGFEALHPGVRVQIENIPGEGQYLPKLLMMFVAGRAPDVIHLDASSAAVFIDNGLLLDLAPVIEQDRAFDLDDYFDVVVDVARRGDRVFAVPLDFTPMVAYYNRRLFREAGVPFPRDGWTWDDFLRTAEAMTVREPGRGSPTQFGFYYTSWMPGWVPWVWLNDGDVLSPDGTRASGHWDGTATLGALRFLTDLVAVHRVAPSLAETSVAGVDLFRAERAAMHVAGHWMLQDYRADGLDVGVVSLPTNTRRPATVIYASSLAINRATARLDLAWEYVKYMTSVDVQIKRNKQGLAISGNRRAAAFYANDDIEQAFLRAVDHARVPWGARVEAYSAVEDLGRQMIEDVLLGAPLEETAARTALLIDAELRR